VTYVGGCVCEGSPIVVIIGEKYDLHVWMQRCTQFHADNVVSLERLQPRYTTADVSSSGLLHPDCLLHGSALLFQSVLNPNVFAISLKACAAKDIYDQIQPIKYASVFFG
jgi:hypothetical protein